MVTGGAADINLGIVRRPHEAGANVVIADIDSDAAERAASEFDGNGRILVVTGDVSKAEDADAVVRAAVDRFGALDVLVNNVGAPHLLDPACI